MFIDVYADLLYVGEGLTRFCTMIYELIHFSTMFSTIMTMLYDLKHIIRDFPPPLDQKIADNG